MSNADIKRAAIQHLQGIEDDLEHDLMDACMPHDEMDDIEEYIKKAFLAGCEYIIKQIQKENESKVDRV